MVLLYWGIFVVFTIISFVVSQAFYSKFEKFTEDSFSEMTGRDVAVKMLKDKNIKDVKVEINKGLLTNFYNPSKNTLKLSEAVYYGKNVYVKALVAHESGHVIQHAISYKGLFLRSKFMPFVKYLSKWAPWIMLAGLIILLIQENLGYMIMLIGAITYILAIILALIAYPIEHNASKRAMQWLDYKKFTCEKETELAKTALIGISKIYILMTSLTFASLVYNLPLNFELKSENIFGFSEL